MDQINLSYSYVLQFVGSIGLHGNGIVINNLTKSLRKVIIVVCAETSISKLLPVPPPKIVFKYWYVCRNNWYILNQIKYPSNIKADVVPFKMVEISMKAHVDQKC